VTFRKYSFQKLPQFSQGINVLNAAVSNIHGFLWRDTCVSSSQRIGLFVANRGYIDLKNYDLLEV
jgi:hypothetical protein